MLSPAIRFAFKVFLLCFLVFGLFVMAVCFPCKDECQVEPFALVQHVSHSYRRSVNVLYLLDLALGADTHPTILKFSKPQIKSYLMKHFNADIPVYQAWHSVVPDIIKNDLFILAYLSRNGGVYANHTLSNNINDTFNLASIALKAQTTNNTNIVYAYSPRHNFFNDESSFACLASSPDNEVLSFVLSCYVRKVLNYPILVNPIDIIGMHCFHEHLTLGLSVRAFELLEPQRFVVRLDFNHVLHKLILSDGQGHAIWTAQNPTIFHNDVFKTDFYMYPLLNSFSYPNESGLVIFVLTGHNHPYARMIVHDYVNQSKVPCVSVESWADVVPRRTKQIIQDVQNKCTVLWDCHTTEDRLLLEQFIQTTCLS